MRLAILLLLACSFHARSASSVTLAWDYADMSPLAGFRIGFGSTSGNYTNITNLGKVLTATITGIPPGFVYFVAYAVGTNGLVSDPSAELGYTNGPGPVPDPVVGLIAFRDPEAAPFIEAESGVLVAPMAAVNDATARGGKYVRSATAEQGTLTLSFSVAQAGTYVVWCRVISADGGSDSFYVTMDAGVEDSYHAAQDASSVNVFSNNWQWTRINGPNFGNPRTFALIAGTHSLRFRGREPTPLDAIYITTNLTATPPP
jgi:hypothetical protein